jgi:hypothetical protein
MTDELPNKGVDDLAVARERIREAQLESMGLFVHAFVMTLRELALLRRDVCPRSL